MIDRKCLLATMDNAMKPHGFLRKRSSTWYLDEGDLIKVVNLQKSSYSNLYYPNLSIYFKAIGGSDEPYPKEEECHIRTRLGSRYVGLEQEYDYLFNLEEVNMDCEKYAEKINECVKSNILPQLELIKTKEGILKLAEKFPAIIGDLTPKAADYFHI